MNTTSSTPLAAADPFNGKNADLILRSSDGVHFSVHKAILSVASNVFRDIFSWPQTDSGNMDGERTSVYMSEDSSTLDSLLRFCYPVKYPIIDDLWAAAKILEAAIKYQMEEIAEIVSESIKKFIPLYPVAVYGLACRPSIHSETLAMVAATEWMEQNPSWVASYFFYRKGWLSGERFATKEWTETSIGGSYDSEYMDRTTAGQLYRLLRCIRLRQLPSKLLVNEEKVGMTKISQHYSLPYLLGSHIPKFLQGDIIIRSSDRLDFRAYKVVLQLASENLLSSLEVGTDQSRGPGESETPVYHLPEHSSLVLKLLEICDPSATAGDVEDAGDADLIYGILRIAMKYDIPKAVSFVQLNYFTAIQHRWEELARKSARATVYSSVEYAYTPEMEHVSALSYYSLMKYHHECQRILSTFLQKHGPPSHNEGTKLLKMLFSIPSPKDGGIEVPFVSRQWDCESITILCYASKMFSKNNAFDNEEFQSTLKSSKRELEENLNTVKLDWE
ncbi:hypothetical protein BDQ17DRAFT_1373767 [Cyathus striatus]|nr:hypothetical protein BDQ17DRAFT_1373767 [Cyathus striatus]